MTMASAEGPSTGNGTGVFIPQCILDGSALTNPAIFGKPHRKRRGSTGQPQSESKHSSSSPSAANKSQKQQAGQAQQQQAAASPQAAASSSCAAKNPFAATPKNIRQQQLLCNLVAAADCFSEAAGLPPPTPGSRRPSLDLSAVQAACGASRAPSVDLPCSSSRTSLDSYYYSRSSGDVSSARPSTDQSCRSSFDHCSSYSSRPSVESTFSCYGPISPAQQYQATATAGRSSFDLGAMPTPRTASRQATWPGRGGLDLGHRPALDLGSRPLVGGVQPQQQRACSIDLASHARLSFDLAPGPQRISLDNSECSDAWHWQQQQQQGGERGVVRRDSSNVSSASSYSTDSGMEAAAAAALAAQQAAAGGWAAPSQTALMQLQQQLILQGGMPCSNAAFGGMPPVTAALPPARPSHANTCGSGSNSHMQQELNLIQQQLQQIIQANQMAAAASLTAVQAASAAAPGPFVGPASSLQQQQRLQHALQLQQLRDAAAWQRLLEQHANGMAGDQGAAEQQAALARMAVAAAAAGQHGSSLDAAVSAASLQQQLEMLQLMQL